MNQEEILNIDHHRKLLVIKALNKYNTIREAAAAIGKDMRTIHRYIRRYSLTRNRLTKECYETNNRQA